MRDLIALTDHWQTLLGSLLGGLLGFIAAWFVAWSLQRRADKAAAMHLVATTVQFRAANDRIKTISRQQAFTSEEERAEWIAARLAIGRPKLSQLFDQSRLQIMPLEPSASAHLEFLHFHYLNFEEKFARFALDLETLQKTRGRRRDAHHTTADAVSAVKSFEAAGTHAACAEHLLSHHVLGRRAFFNRLRPKFLWHPKTVLAYEMLSNPEPE